MLKPIFCFALATFSAVGASAQSVMLDSAGYAGSYFCVSDAAGGVWFDKATNKWIGSTFSASERYVVKIVQHSLMPDTLGNMSTTYTVSVAAHGQQAGEGIPCTSANGDLRKVDVGLNFIGETGEFSCMQFGGEWVMNLKNMRFLQSYLWGYVDGVDDNRNTPYVQIGTCTKID
jgi:hypothetical protein